MNISNEEIMQMIASSLQLSLKQVSTTLELLNEGNTVPFIARYRKERTDSLDEIQIRKIEQKYQEDTQLIKEKNRILDTLNEQGKLT
ncbi:MAG: RNA-binding transcriptional accessory protein, partial [Candidatus Heimdallarchaeota archaeon]|nr:RNA-binding transcriptional accessory protein [Candidatus Heimdallarchaeota archaeon]